MVYVTVTKLSADFTLIDDSTGQRKDNRPLHDITVDLLSKGFTLKATAGADTVNASDPNSLASLVMVFHKEGIVEDDEPIKEVKPKKSKEKSEKKDKEESK